MNVPAPQPHEGTVVTVMSGSEGSGIIRAVVRVLLKRTDAHVNVVCGRNKKLRKKLKKAFGEQYHGRLSVMGFVDDIQNVMAASDILILRASPNAAMEAVALNVPVILFGQLAGQEQHNPDVLQAGPGACPSPRRCPNAKATGSVPQRGGAKVDARPPPRACAPPHDRPPPPAPRQELASTPRKRNDDHQTGIFCFNGNPLHLRWKCRMDWRMVQMRNNVKYPKTRITCS